MFKAGQTVSLPVTITGLPKPSVKWYHNDTDLVTSGDISIENVDKDYTVSVKKGTRVNSGKYKVVAENKVGTDEAVFDVFVKGLYGSIVRKIFIHGI